jgi:hypothetical protein
MERMAYGFTASCGTCHEELVPKTDGDVEELLERARVAQEEYHQCKASELKKWVVYLHNKLTGPRISINGKRVKFRGN